MDDITCLRCGKPARSVSDVTGSMDGETEREDFYCDICKLILHKQTFRTITITYYQCKPPENELFGG